jgi:hypothetical protein
MSLYDTQLLDDDDDDDRCCVHMISVHPFRCVCIKKFKVLEVEVACLSCSLWLH